MPSAGTEGYEKMVVCPYDKSHEIRKGRMQFHLEKCRQNYPMSQLTDCPNNKLHKIPQAEMQYHMEEECKDRYKWERYTYETPSVECPVKELVPVNAASVPDGGENWESSEPTNNTSVLNKIKAEAENKPIVRLCQVKSKAVRKQFRRNERERHAHQAELGGLTESSASSASKLDSLPLPTVQSHIKVFKQDPEEASALLERQFRTFDLNMKSQASASTAPSETSSMCTEPPSEYAYSVTSSQTSYADASRPKASRPPSVWSNETTDTSFMTALTSQHATVPRMNAAMSDKSFATASQGAPQPRPPSAMSNSSMAESMMSLNTVSSNGRSPGSIRRPTCASNIAASATAYKMPDTDEEGFSQIPIPGLGRGRRPKPNN